MIDTVTWVICGGCCLITTAGLAACGWVLWRRATWGDE